MTTVNTNKFVCYKPLFDAEYKELFGLFASQKKNVFFISDTGKKLIKYKSSHNLFLRFWSSIVQLFAISIGIYLGFKAYYYDFSWYSFDSQISFFNLSEESEALRNKIYKISFCIFLVVLIFSVVTLMVLGFPGFYSYVIKRKPVYYNNFLVDFFLLNCYYIDIKEPKIV